MPTDQDLQTLQATMAVLANDSTFAKLFSTAPPKIVYDDARITNNSRIIAAYWPDENTISFKTGRTDLETIRHEFYHANQIATFGVDYCDRNNCEVAAYEFEKMHARAFLRMSHYNATRDWWIN